MIQYQTEVGWDVTLKDLGYTDATTIGAAFAGLVTSAVKVTTGVPAVTAGKFIPGAIIQNASSGVIYQNTGTTATPVWSIIESSGSGALFNVVAAGKFTTVGGDADETLVVAGVLATDTVVASMQTLGAVPVTLLASAPGAGDINFTMSADPGTDHILSYVVYRAA